MAILGQQRVSPLSLSFMRFPSDM
ncbi:hypothetical protein CCACVL1_21296, partial [Corchorus capsularis]